MSNEEQYYQVLLEQLLEKADRTRSAQRTNEKNKLFCRQDWEKKKRLERELDQLITKAKRELESKQQMIF